MAPDGLFTDMWCPVLAIRHDNYLLAQYKLMHKMTTYSNTLSGHPYSLYGDPAYGLSDNLICSFSTVTHGPLTPDMADFNKKTNHCRVTVE